MNKTWKKINQTACYNRIWSWSPVPCEKHGPRASVTTKTSAFGLGFCLLSPSGHVFHTARETMIKSYKWYQAITSTTDYHSSVNPKMTTTNCCGSYPCQVHGHECIWRKTTAAEINSPRRCNTQRSRCQPTQTETCCETGKIEGSVQDCSNSSASAMELLQSCTKPLRWYFCFKPRLRWFMWDDYCIFSWIFFILVEAWAQPTIVQPGCPSEAADGEPNGWNDGGERV